MRTVDPVQYEAKRRHIIAAAAGCFAREGFEGTTIAEICARAGISSGNLFHYFPNKRAIFRAIFEQDGEDTRAFLRNVAGTDDPWGAILDFINLTAGPAAEPDAPGLVLAVIAQASRDDEFAKLVDGNDRETRAGLAQLLGRAADAGQIDARIDPMTAASWITALVNTLYTHAWSDPECSPAEQLPTLRLLVTRFLQAAPRDV